LTAAAASAGEVAGGGGVGALLAAAAGGQTADGGHSAGPAPGGDGRAMVDLLPPPPPAVRRPAAAGRGVWGTALVRRQLGVVGLSAPPVTVELAAGADLVLAAVVPSVAMATTLGRASWARVSPPPPPVIAPVAWLPAGTFGHALGAWAETRSEEEHTKLRHDLVEDVWAERATLIEPYL